MPSIPRKVDRVALLLVKECGLPAVQTGRRSTQGVSQQVNEHVFINRHRGEISWHVVVAGRVSVEPVLTIRLRGVPNGVEVVITEGKEERRIATEDPTKMTVKANGRLAAGLREFIDALWSGMLLESSGDVDPESPMSRRLKEVLAKYRARVGYRPKP
jgi:hypothetical protein